MKHNGSSVLRGAVEIGLPGHLEWFARAIKRRQQVRSRERSEPRKESVRHNISRAKREPFNDAIALAQGSASRNTRKTWLTKHQGDTSPPRAIDKSLFLEYQYHGSFADLRNLDLPRGRKNAK